jgi:outer membrane usher protein
MRRLQSWRSELTAALALALALAALPGAQRGARAAAQTQPLQLEVFINDKETQLIGTFVRLSDGRIAAQPNELVEIGLKVQRLSGAEALIAIDELPGVVYRYDEPTQKIYLTCDDDQRITKSYDARGAVDRPLSAQSDYGAALNYTLFGATTKQLGKSQFTFSGANASLDARLFSPFGTLTQTAIMGTTTAREIDTLRLETTFTYSDQETMRTYRGGDMISGGLPWTRSIRLGGVQVQRNFGLRSDLVTLPLPAFSGSAAVPSTVDVYVNNLKTYSQDVAAGPYQISNVPGLSGSGTARVVLRDSAGREVETTLPFYTSPRLLREGLMDYSLEAGLPRMNFGTDSNSYALTPVGSASVRRGIYDWLTVEGHAEGGAGLYNGGIGAVAALGPFGVLSAAGSASRFDDAFGAVGYQAYAAYDVQFKSINFHLSSLRTFGTYNDLATVTARSPSTPIGLPIVNSGRPARAQDTVSISFPLFDFSSFSIACLRQEQENGTISELLNVSYSRPLPYGASVYVTAFADLRDRNTSGIFVGLSIPLGKDIQASAGVTRTRDGMNYSAEAMKMIAPEPGSYGWRVRDSEGTSPYRAATAGYRTTVAQVEGSVRQNDGTVVATAQAEGAIAVMGGGIFFTNRIDDAFAVINVGAPNVNVLHENRPAGKTNAQGQILIPSLASYQKNNIAIDPQDLPLDADAPVTQTQVTPAHRGGVVVNLDVKTEAKGALVVLHGKDGKVLSPGSSGKLEGGSEPFVVGYDGRAYVKGLVANNTVVVTHAGGQCRASFPYTPDKTAQVSIGPVVCE